MTKLDGGAYRSNYYKVKKPLKLEVVNPVIDRSKHLLEKSFKMHQYVSQYRGHCIKKNNIVPLNSEQNLASLSGHTVLSTGRFSKSDGSYASM